MKPRTITARPWSWQRSALVFLISVVPTLALAALVDRNDTLEALASAEGLVLAPAAIVMAIYISTAWRLSEQSAPGWLVAASVAVAVQSVGLAVLEVTDVAGTAEQRGWMALIDLVLILTALACRAGDGRGLLRTRPALVGLAVGLCIGVARVAVVTVLPAFRPPDAQQLATATTTCVLAGLLVRELLLDERLDTYVARRLAVAVALLSAGRAITCLDDASREPWLVASALMLSAMAAVAFVASAVGLLRQVLTEISDRTLRLRVELEEVEEAQLQQRARMHEIESTMAGIRSASELLSDPGVPLERRARIEALIHAELCRLERLLGSGREMPIIPAARATAPAPAGVVSAAPSVTPVAWDPRDVPVAGIPSPLASRWGIAGGRRTGAHRRGGAHEGPSTSTRRGQAVGPAGLPPVPPRLGTIDLDATISALALFHGAKGTQVRWQPTGRRAVGYPDDVVEVLNILLNNAARHGDAHASVRVQRTPRATEIVVSDHGPGIDPALRERLFEWGAHAAGSSGQGIGLHIARSLMQRQGGYLEVRDSVPAGGAHEGATFVVGLPSADRGAGGGAGGHDDLSA